MLLDNTLDLLLGLGGNSALGDLGKEGLLRAGEMLTELAFPADDLLNGNGIELDTIGKNNGVVLEKTSTYETVDTGVDNGDLDLSGERLVLALFEELSETGTTREQETGRGIEIGTKLGESSDFTVLRKVKLERTSELLHDLTEKGQKITSVGPGFGGVGTTHVWAAEPTRDTERPTLIAGRTPRKKSSASKKIWPSVMEMTLVGM